jgi:hypothetical protein
MQDFTSTILFQAQDHFIGAQEQNQLLLRALLLQGVVVVVHPMVRAVVQVVPVFSLPLIQ